MLDNFTSFIGQPISTSLPLIQELQPDVVVRQPADDDVPVGSSLLVYVDDHGFIQKISSKDGV